MPSDPEAEYLDASVLLAYVRDEPGRAGTVENILTAAAEGKLEVRTSTLSIAEVAYGVWDVSTGVPTPESEQAIERLWQPGSVLRLIEPSVAVMRSARDLIRRARMAGYSLRSADAVHLASATARSDTARIFTYDNKAPQWAEITGLEVSEPFVAEPPLPL